jgi:hypothetical protein
MNEPHEPWTQRAGLPLWVGGFGGVFFLVVLLLTTGGVVFFFVAGVSGVVGLMLFHWLVWGKLLSRLTAGDREAEEGRPRADDLLRQASAPPRAPDHRFRR